MKEKSALRIYSIENPRSAHGTLRILLQCISSLLSTSVI